jgi:hypothetical protein
MQAFKRVRRACRFGRPTVLLVLSMVSVAVAKEEPREGKSSSAKLYYTYDMEDAPTRREQRAGVGRDAGKKKMEFRQEGGGQDAEFVYDNIAKSNVLVIRTDPTPGGRIKDRTELQVYSGVTFGRPWALGMSVFIPKDITFTDNWHLLAQCHQGGGGGALSPPLSLNLVAPDKLVIVSRSDEDKYRALHTEAMPRGKWVRLEMEFQMGENGNAKLWMDGKKVADEAAPLRFKEGTDKCSLKVGTYRGKATTPHELRLDDVRFGDSREAVALRNARSN